MALTDATRLADFSSGVGTDGTLSANNINATGVVTATSFVGSGSGLTGIASTDNIITGTAATFTAGINVTGAAVTISNAGVNVTGIVTATSFSGALTGNVTGDVQGDVTGDVTGNVTGNINASSATGISTVGILTAYSSININVGGGSTEIATELKTKASTGKAIAMSMVFG